MKSSLSQESTEADLAFIEKLAPEVFDEDETLMEEEDDDDLCMEHARCQALDEHFAMKAYAFASRAEQQEIYNKFTRIRGALSEEFCEMRDEVRQRLRRPNKHYDDE